ncbi:hypothetical protein T02_524 [Trichinella nativa]|uniref:Uncharacterized protein n=1 Tax=Trichinella nativa TaxID=6335 RepID=A0A0V1KK89_9BILA|nr:hypothetical protein T02_524 [Trichinella nativa]
MQFTAMLSNKHVVNYNSALQHHTSDAEDEDKEVSISFDYCSVHVSTMISHVSQQFRFLVFFIVTQWVVSVQNGLHHQHRARSYSCVNGVTQYRSRNLCGFVYHRSIHNHVDKYVITKHHYQLMPLSLATSGFRDAVKGNMANYKSGYAWGYASGKIPKISNFLKYSPRLCPQATPQGK